MMNRPRAVLVAAALLLSVPTTAEAAVMTARSAGAFRDSVGVNTHFGFYDRAYFQTSEPVVQGLIKDLGVAHIRDSICFSASNPNCDAANQRIANLHGIYAATSTPSVRVRVTGAYAPLANKYVSAPATNRQNRNNDILFSLATMGDGPFPAGQIEAIEGTNEADKSLPAPDWATQDVGDVQRANTVIASGVDTFAPLVGLPHLAPSAGAPKNSSALATTPGWQSSMVSRGNLHPYPGVGVPENAFGISCTDPATYNFDPAVSPQVNCAQQVAGSGRPTQVTETGYTNGAAYCDSRYISRQATAIYTPRLVLENFRRGIERTFLYELIDNNVNYNTYNDAFGLVSAQLSSNKIVVSGKKPAFLALQNTLGLIGDLGATTANPGSLDVTVGTTAAPATDVPQSEIRKVLLRRANGSWVLALWKPAQVAKWNATWPCWTYADVAVAPTTYRVTLGAAGSAYAINRYQPTTDAAVKQSATGTRTIDVPIGADVTLLSIN